ncbi:glycoside hydrolase family 3 N-terminal domain-containing protein [Viscerimonas tarda]
MNIRRSLFVIAILLVSLFISSNTQSDTKPIEPDIFKNADKAKMNQWVDSVFSQMTIDQKVGQVIMAITTGEEANKQKLIDYVNNQSIGGIIFLKGTPPEQAELTNACQQATKVPLMIAIDGEWGLSMRLENTTRFPKNMMLGAIEDDSLIYYYGLEVARQCRVMGIHVNFAPDMDVNSNPDNPVIGIRSYGESPERVAKLGILYAKGLEAGGVMSVAKHFPGHGDTSTDSHHVLPLVKHDKGRLNSFELPPFKEYIHAGLSGMMIAHLNVPELDKSGAPSSLSKAVITDLLQHELGFTGLIFTDGLTMKGVSNEANMSVKALSAGNDMLVGPIDPVKEFDAIKTAALTNPAFMTMLEEKCKKLLSYKYILGVHKTEAVDVATLDKKLNTSYADWLARKMNEKAITLLKNEEHTIPVKHLEKKKIAAISIGASDKNPFHETLNLYGNVTCFNVEDASSLTKIQSDLTGFNTLIVSVHSNKSYNAQAIKNAIGERKSLLVFFSTPYKLSGYSSIIKDADAVVMAYENTDYAQEYAAQALFGGNTINGKLPVSVKRLFKEGNGHETEKTRLSYGLPEDVGMQSYKLNDIESIVNEGIAAQAFPGCQVLVAKDGVVIYNRSFGHFEYNNSRPVTNADIYDIASMTKASATLPAIMKLYDEKKITLQNALSKFVPELKHTNKETLSIKEALLHETGLPAFLPYYLPAIDKDSYLGRLYSNLPSGAYTVQLDENTWGRTDYRFKTDLISYTPKPGFTLQVAGNLYANKAYKDTIIQMIADARLRPKKSYLYSCLNFILLKEVAEHISETDLNTFLQTNFYEKLGAITTTFNPLKQFDKSRIAPTEKDDFLRKQLLQGYVHDEGAAFMGGIGGNAGLFSNANDLAKLYQMWLNKGEYGDERYLSKETCRLFTTSKSAASRRGLGFDKPDARNNKLSPCSPQTPVATYGHTGFTGTCFWIDPDNKLIYIFLSNRVYDSRLHKNLMSLNIRTRIQEEIYNAMKK